MDDVVIVTTLWDGVPCQCVEIGPIYVEIFFSYADTDDKSGIKMNPSIYSSIQNFRLMERRVYTSEISCYQSTAF